MAMNTPESNLEKDLVAKLRDLKYDYRPDIHDRAALEANFRKSSKPSIGSRSRTASSGASSTGSSHRTCTKPRVSLRNREAFVRDDGTPLNYTLVNIKTGARTPSRSSINSASIPTTAITAMTSCC